MASHAVCVSEERPDSSSRFWVGFSRLRRLALETEKDRPALPAGFSTGEQNNP